MPEHDKYLVGLDVNRFPAGAKEVLIALGQLQSNEVIDRTCHFCGQLITGEILGAQRSVWKTSCPCGKSTSTFRGL